MLSFRDFVFNVDHIRDGAARQVNVLPHREIRFQHNRIPTQSQYTDTGPTSPNTVLIMSTPDETAAGVPILKS